MKTTVLLLAILLTLLFTSCENQSHDNVTARIKFASFRNNKSQPVTRASEAGGILIDSATLSLQNINLLIQSSNGQITGSGNPVFPGPYLINLISHTSKPVIESSMVTAGTYFGINGLLYVPQDTKASIYVSGTYTLNDKWWKFYYSNSASLTFQVIDSAGFTIDQSNPEIWVVIDVVSFFRGVDFSKAIIDNDNVIRINDSSNSNLAVAIQKNFILAATVSTIDQSQVLNGNNGSSGGNSSGNSGSVSNSGNNNNSGTSGKIDNSGNNNQSQDKEKNKDKGKNGTKSKHNQKDNNKSKNKNKDKDKDKDH